MKSATNFDELYRQLRVRLVPFLAVFFAVVFLTYLVLYIIDFIPEAPDEGVDQDTETVIDTVAAGADTPKEVLAPVLSGEAAVPNKIIFDRLNREVVVLNPQSRDIVDLDAALLSGVVRHPDSADFRSEGNMFILGHSSYLPNVLNKNFQAFNGIQEMTWGDKIRVQSAETEYVYRVEKVYKAKASEVFVPETPGEARLTLATCNSFGSKDDRFMIEAILIDQKAL
jgi:LPXTG-site transpeptidase (sortase) family protein